MCLHFIRVLLTPIVIKYYLNIRLKTRTVINPALNDTVNFETLVRGGDVLDCIISIYIYNVIYTIHKEGVRILEKPLSQLYRFNW